MNGSRCSIGCIVRGAISSCKARATTARRGGTFALRSPVRPNPIGTLIVKLIGIEGATLLVRGLDCLDGTPLLDIKPDRCLLTPLAPPTPGDSHVGDF